MKKFLGSESMQVVKCLFTYTFLPVLIYALVASHA